MQHGLETILPVALRDNRGAHIEINIQIFRLPSSYREIAARNLPGGNLDASLGFAGQLQRMNAVICGQHYTVCRPLTLVSRKR